jgi:4-hydroxybenzoate polyprenyltransferase
MRALIRFDDWWYSKVGTAMGVGLWIVLANHSSFASAVPKLLFAISAVAALGAFGYAVNDIADREIDRKCGKVRPAASLNVRQSLVLVVASLLGGLAACIPLGADAAYVLGAGYALAAIYSLPPVRLKERGLVGVLAGGVAQRTIPSALLLALFDAGLFADGVLLAWSTLVGMRWLLVHQLVDERSDRMADVTTYVTAEGARLSHGLIDYVLFPAELLLFITLVVVSTPWLALAFAPAAATWSLTRTRRRSEGVSFATLTLADLYETWWPLAVAVALAARDPRFALFAIAHVPMFWKINKWRWSLFVPVPAVIDK